MKEIQIYTRSQHYDNIPDFSLESKKIGNQMHQYTKIHHAETTKSSGLEQHKWIHHSQNTESILGRSTAIIAPVPGTAPPQQIEKCTETAPALLQ